MAKVMVEHKVRVWVGKQAHLFVGVTSIVRGEFGLYLYEKNPEPRPDRWWKRIGYEPERMRAFFRRWTAWEFQ